MQYESRSMSISFRFFNFVEERLLKYDLIILCISFVSIVMSSCLFLTQSIWIFSLCVKVSLDKGLSVVLTYSNNHQTCDFFEENCLSSNQHCNKTIYTHVTHFGIHIKCKHTDFILLLFKICNFSKALLALVFIPNTQELEAG